MSQETIDADHQPLADAGQPLLTRTLKEWRVMAVLGTPILIGQVAQMLNGVIDTIMAGRAGADDLTGVAIGINIWAPLFLFMIGVLNATQPIISGHRGAKEYHRIMPVAWNAIFIGLGAAVIAIVVLLNVHPLFSSLLGMEPEAARITKGYLQAFAWCIPAVFTLVALRGLTDGLGFTKAFMAVSLLTAVINAPLNYIFIFGKLGVPAMGGIGCGWATSIANWIALVVFFSYLNVAKHFREFHFFRSRALPNWQQIKTILRLGIPIGFTIFVESTMFAVIALMLAPLGSIVVAGHQIALNVVSFMFMVPLSLGMALTIRISFLIGARQPNTARLVSRSSLLLVTFICIAYAFILFTLRESIASLYSTEADVIAVATLLLAYGAMFQFADVLQVVAISALRGYKDTRIPMVIMLTSFWGIGIPLGYVLAYKDWIVEPLGAPGFWIGLIAGLTHAACWLIFRLFWFSGNRKMVDALADQVAEKNAAHGDVGEQSIT